MPKFVAESPMPPRSLVSLNVEGFSLSETGLSVHGSPTLEKWVEAGKSLKKADGCLQWWIGDWMNLGERVYGKSYKEAAKITGFQEVTLRRYAYVARKFPVEVRQLAALEQPEKKPVSPGIQVPRRLAPISFKHFETVAPLVVEEEKKAEEASAETAEAAPLDGGEPKKKSVFAEPVKDPSLVRKAVNWLKKAIKGDKCRLCAGKGSTDGQPCKKCGAKGTVPWSVSRLKNEVSRNKLDAEGYPAWLRHTDVWSFASPDFSMGADWPGRIAGQIVLNALYYWTEENDLVVDPMAGGGVTIDACARYNRRCIAFDRNPCATRNDILKADATEPWPVKEPVDLVFNDPPYFSQKEADYGGMATKTYPEFLADLGAVYQIAYKRLKKGGRLVVLIAPTSVKEEKYLDTPIDICRLCLGLGFALERRVSVPEPKFSIEPGVIKARRERKEMIGTLRDLLVFRK